MEIQTRDWHGVTEQTAEGTKTTVFGKVTVPTSSTVATLVANSGIGPRDNSLQLEILLQDNSIGLQVLTEKTVTFSVENWDGTRIVRIFYKNAGVATFMIENHLS